MYSRQRQKGLILFSQIKAEKYITTTTNINEQLKHCDLNFCFTYLLYVKNMYGNLFQVVYREKVGFVRRFPMEWSDRSKALTPREFLIIPF